MTLKQKLGGFNNNGMSVVERSFAKNTLPTVSFIIPAYNSSGTIELVLDSINKQSEKALIEEIIIINDYSTDNTTDILKKLVYRYPELDIVILSNPRRRYAAYSRNRGIKICKGDIVCFIDSDIVLPEDYMIKHVRSQILGGGISFSLRSRLEFGIDERSDSNLELDDFRYKILKAINFDLEGKGFYLTGSSTLADMCLTCAVTYWRDDLLAVRGCPQNFVGWGFNDKAMAAKVIALGRQVCYVDECEVKHIEHPPRSGDTNQKWKEYSINRRKYLKMLDMEFDLTCRYELKEIDT